MLAARREVEPEANEGPPGAVIPGRKAGVQAAVREAGVAAVREKRLSSRQEPVGDDEKDGRLRGTMLMRSTGLGKAELVAEIVSLRRQGDYLIMELRTTQPVRWKIRGGLSHQDLRMLIRAMMKMSVIAFLLDVRAWFRKPKHPGDF